MINKKNLMRILFAGMAVSAVMTACSIEERLEINNETVEVNGRELSADAFEQGLVVIKLSEEAADEMDIRINAEGRIISTGVRSLDEFIPELNITRIERSFPHGGKFEARRRKAGLHLWYHVYFDEQTPLSRAGVTLKSAEGVNHMEYRPKMMLVGNSPVLMSDPLIAPAAAEQGGSQYFDDPSLPLQWHYYNDGNTVTGQGIAGCDVNVLPVWKDGILGNPDVIVAVVDEGVDYKHEDLAANMWEGTNEKGEPINGADFSGRKIGDVNYTIEPRNHGTHVAGTIAAVNNNGIGVCGIAGGDFKNNIPGVKIMSCQVFDANGSSSQRGHEAIAWSADYGAVISQNSWGYVPGSDVSAIYELDKAAVDYFIENAGFDENGNQVGPMAGGIVIFAAGNDNLSTAFPASYERCLTVSSLYSNYGKSAFSNYGPWVDIAAPGGSWVGDGTEDWIYSTMVNNGYGYNSGTSMACPHVSGVAALVVSHFANNITPEELRYKLLSTVTPIDQYNPEMVGLLGAGLIDAEKAIRGIKQGTQDVITDLSATSEADNINFSVTIPKGGGQLSLLYMLYSEEKITEENYTSAKIAVFDISNVQPGEVFASTIPTRTFETAYYLAAKTLTSDDALSALSNMVQVTTGPNSAPVITPLDGEVLSVKLRAKSTFRYLLTDPDGHSITAIYSPEQKYITMKFEEGNDTLSFTFNGNTASKGEYTINLTVTDEIGLSTVLPIKYIVAENKAPVLVQEIPTVKFATAGDAPYSFDVAGEYVLDLDDDPLTVEIVNITGDDAADISIDGSVITCTPKAKGKMTVDITVSDPVGRSVVTKFNVEVKRNGGNKPAEESLLVFYPNPVSDFLYVKDRKEAEGAESQMYLYSSTGSLVMEEMVEVGGVDASGDTKAIDMSNLPAGVYNIKVIYKGQEVVNSIVKL